MPREPPVTTATLPSSDSTTPFSDMEQRYGRELEEANLAVKRVALDNDSIALIILLSDYMREKLISVTEAARNFADSLNRPHYQNVTFVLLQIRFPSPPPTPHHPHLLTHPSF